MKEAAKEASTTKRPSTANVSPQMQPSTASDTLNASQDKPKRASQASSDSSTASPASTRRRSGSSDSISVSQTSSQGGIASSRNITHLWGDRNDVRRSSHENNFSRSVSEP